MTTFFPAQYSRNVYQGDTVEFTVTYKEGASVAEQVGVSLTGATLVGEIKAAKSDADATAAFTVTADADQVTNPGLMSVVLPAAQSALLTGSSYVYDIEVTWADATVQTLVYGTLSVTRGVSN